MTRLNIQGMTCPHCVKAVNDALAGIDGVDKVSVDLDQGSAEIEGTADTAALVAAIEDAGYTASAA